MLRAIGSVQCFTNSFPTTAEKSLRGAGRRSRHPGVWVAGNVTDVGAQVVGAAAAGTMAGAAINMELVESDLRERVA